MRATYITIFVIYVTRGGGVFFFLIFLEQKNTFYTYIYVRNKKKKKKIFRRWLFVTGWQAGLDMDLTGRGRGGSGRRGRRFGLGGSGWAVRNPFARVGRRAGGRCVRIGTQYKRLTAFSVRYG